MLYGYLMMNINIPCCKCCSRYCILNKEDDLVIDHSTKTKLQKGNTIFRVLCLALISLMFTSFGSNWTDYIYSPIILDFICAGISSEPSAVCL